MLSVVMPNVIMVSVVRLNVIRLNAVRLNVVMMSVVAPIKNISVYYLWCHLKAEHIFPTFAIIKYFFSFTCSGLLVRGIKSVLCKSVIRFDTMLNAPSLPKYTFQCRMN